jgi:Icc-related predicted phosphoesterase
MCLFLGLEVNTDGTKYMNVEGNQNQKHTHNITTSTKNNLRISRVSYLGTAPRNTTEVQDENGIRINSQSTVNSRLTRVMGEGGHG